MDMASLTYSHSLAKVVKEGRVSEAYIDQMVLPILEAKFDLGLFDHPYVDEASVDTILNRPEGLALERKLAGRSMVLLRDENRTLPLSKELKKIAVIGPLADAAHDVEGGWTVEGLFGNGSKSHPVTVLAGIKNRLSADAQVTACRRTSAVESLYRYVGAVYRYETYTSSYSSRNRRMDCQSQGYGCGCGRCRGRHGRNGEHER